MPTKMQILLLLPNKTQALDAPAVSLYACAPQALAAKPNGNCVPSMRQYGWPF